MTHRSRSRVGFLGVLCLGAALAAWGCDQGGSDPGTPTGPSRESAGSKTAEPNTTATPTPTPSPTPTPTPTPTPSPTPAPTPSALVEMLNASIADEYRMYYTYERILADLSDPKPFSNITEGEVQHIAALAKLFDKRGLPVPESPYAITTVPGFTTLSAACWAAVEAENLSYKRYESYLATLGAEPQDVVSVFTSLMLASRDNHLPAFTNCAK